MNEQKLRLLEEVRAALQEICNKLVKEEQEEILKVIETVDAILTAEKLEKSVSSDILASEQGI